MGKSFNTGNLTNIIGYSGSNVAITGSVNISGTVVSTGTSLVSGSGQISYTGITNIPSGIVSGSAQTIANLPSGVVSGSVQVTTFGFGTTGSNTFQGSQTINGSLVVTGSLTAQQFIVSSSVTYLTESFASGSHKFGDSIDDTHQFTGSLYVSGTNHYIQGNIFINSGSNNAASYLTLNKGYGFDGGLVLSTSGSNDWQIVNQTGTGDLWFYNYGTSYPSLYIKRSNGYIGIGNTGSLFARLHVNDSLTSGSIAIGAMSYPTLLYSTATTGEFRIDNRTSFASGYITFFPAGQGSVSGSEAVRITEKGFLGIGLSSPTTLLHTYTSSVNVNNVSAEFLNDDYTSGTRNFIRVRNKINAGGSMSSYFGQGQDGKTYILANDFTKNHIVIDGSTTSVGIGTNIPAVGLDMSAKTDAFHIAVGTTAQRPTVANGLVRYNTDLQSLEAYITNNWVSLQTSANNGYGWRRPSTLNISGILADGDRSWYSDLNRVNGYCGVVLNHVFTGDFTIVASWQRNYMGLGMVYKSGATLLDFNGYSVDGNGNYFGGASTAGLSVGTYGSYSYLGLYPGPAGTGPINGTKYYIKWQRSGNSLTMMYNTTGPWSAWTNFSTGNAATCASGDSVIVGAGQAQAGTEVEPLKLLYVIGN